MTIHDFPDDLLLTVLAKTFSARDLVNVKLADKRLSQLELPDSIWEDVYERHPWSNGREPTPQASHLRRFVQRLNMERADFHKTQKEMTRAIRWQLAAMQSSYRSVGRGGATHRLPRAQIGRCISVLSSWMPTAKSSERTSKRRDALGVYAVPAAISPAQRAV